MRRNKRLTVMLVLVILVMSLTVGYAVLSTTLNINGTSTIGNARWDIHFENIQVKQGSVTASTAAVINSAKDTVTYVINLAKPGDYYEFTVDVRNAGTIDGMIESITSKINNQPISNKPVYLDYYVTYNDGIEIEPNHLLSAGLSDKLRVHVGFSTDISASDLPGSSQTYTLTLNLKETQATSAATEREHYIYTLSNVTVNVGGTLPNGYSAVDHYSDLSGTNWDTYEAKQFLRLKVAGGIIREAHLGIFAEAESVSNGMTPGLYYFKGGDAGASYLSNKAIALTAYQESNCNYDDNGMYCWYPYLSLLENGGVSLLQSGGSGCSISATGAAHC